MRLISVVSSIFLMHVASGSCSAVSFQCYPNVEVSWSFDRITNKSEFHENTNDLSIITLYLDTGFLKFLAAQNNETALFRQQAIKTESQDPLDITVRYEDTNKISTQKTGIILLDPMCKRSADATVSLFKTGEFGYRNINYRCDCLSPTNDNDNFVHK